MYLNSDLFLRFSQWPLPTRFHSPGVLSSDHSTRTGRGYALCIPLECLEVSPLGDRRLARMASWSPCPCLSFPAPRQPASRRGAALLRGDDLDCPNTLPLHDLGTSWCCCHLSPRQEVRLQLSPGPGCQDTSDTACGSVNLLV